MRQREDDDVVAGQGGRVGGLEHAVGQGQQVGVRLAEALARVAVRGHRADLDLGVAQQEAQDLAPGVAGGAGHRCSECHLHNDTGSCMARRRCLAM